jgi:hypothetical protein
MSYGTNHHQRSVSLSRMFADCTFSAMEILDFTDAAFAPPSFTHDLQSAYYAFGNSSFPVLTSIDFGNVKASQNIENWYEGYFMSTFQLASMPALESINFAGLNKNNF